MPDQSIDPADLRVHYAAGELRRADLAAHPMDQLAAWLDDAIAADVPEPNAMTLATVDDRARPDARVVLCKGLDRRGVVLYTNTRSAKGAQLDANPMAGLVFVWLTLERQVRLRGRVERVADATADAYFASRPRGSRVGAWASPQSQVLADRAELEAHAAAAEARFAGDEEVPRPPHWTGYRVVPSEVEFWQGRPSRLHDRFRFRRAVDREPTRDDVWTVDRLAP